MTITEFLWSFCISVVAGLITGALFASKSENRSDSLDIIVNLSIHNTKKYNFNSSETLSHYKSYKSSSSNEDALDAFGIVIVAIILIGIINIFFAHYYKQIITTGWSLIFFFDASIFSFILVSFFKSKKLFLQGFWCLFCLLLVTYEFWLFSNLTFDPSYLNYLNRICQFGTEAVFDSNNLAYWYYPVYQILGLLLLVLVILVTFCQSLALMFWPIADLNNIVLKIFNFCYTSLSGSFIFLQTIFLALAYFFLSGKLFTLFSKLFNH